VFTGKMLYFLRIFSFPESIREYTATGYDHFHIIYKSPSIFVPSVDVTLLVNYRQTNKDKS
jgi:hypothetical protein